MAWLFVVVVGRGGVVLGEGDGQHIAGEARVMTTRAWSAGVALFSVRLAVMECCLCPVAVSV